MKTEEFDLKVAELEKAKNLLAGIRAIKEDGGGLHQGYLVKLKNIIAQKNFERTDLLSLTNEEELKELGI